MNKKLTRKEFILSILSVGALVFASKVPNIVKNINSKKSNTYGNYSYGGIKKNA